MPFVDVLIHSVWATKRREPYLTLEIKKRVIDHIKENSFSKGIFIDTINGYVDHLHCLFGLNADMSISKVLQLLKGESSYWINKNQLTKSRFEWSDEYFAKSIGDSEIDKIRSYIRNQEIHHKGQPYIRKCEEFLEGFTKC